MSKVTPFVEFHRSGAAKERRRHSPESGNKINLLPPAHSPPRGALARRAGLSHGQLFRRGGKMPQVGNRIRPSIRPRGHQFPHPDDRHGRSPGIRVSRDRRADRRRTALHESSFVDAGQVTACRQRRKIPDRPIGRGKFLPPSPELASCPLEREAWPRNSESPSTNCRSSRPTS